MFSKLFNLFRAPSTPKFIAQDPEQAKRENRALSLRAHIEVKTRGMNNDAYTACKKYGEHVIGQMMRDEITLSTAYALIHSYVSRATNTLAPLPDCNQLARVKG